MHLQGLSLSHFRNYASLSLACDLQTNVFIGSNGQGKTNLLEAVYYLCVARSCREAQDRDLVRMGADHFLIQGQGRSAEGREVEVQIRYARPAGKKVFVNESPQRNLSDLYGILAAVVISPDDRRLVQGSPGSRRRFLDIAISQSNAAYLSALQEYRRVVRQRNEALRAYQEKPGRTEGLEVWNAPLVALGSRIMRKRVEVVEDLKEEASRIHAAVSDDNECLEIDYAPSFEYEALADIEQAFEEALDRAAPRERARCMTEVGPHRDDLAIRMNGVSLQAFGSQGQHKTAATALKLAEARFLWRRLQAPPLLLLDDIFAEIDAARTGRLMEMVPGYGQTFITTAKESDIGDYHRGITRFRVQGGAVTPYD